MQSDRFLVHYDPTLPLILATDASPYGVGAVLSHIFPDGTERPLQYASQTLNRTQQRYSQVDKEAYAIIFGIRKFHQYLYGRKFTLETDNKPVSQILSETKGQPTLSAMRMQHYAAFLQSFEYRIRFRRSSNHSNADAMSRLPLAITDPESEIEETDVVEVNSIQTLPLTVDELGSATLADQNVKELVCGLRCGRIVEAKFRFSVRQEEFSLQKDCIMRGLRVYIPPSLRKKVLDELHSTHFGVSRIKSLARAYCWWQGIDGDIERQVQNCASCQVTRSNPSSVSFHCWETPSEPFQRVHADYAGPFMGLYFLILVDAYSKWPVVRIVSNMTTETTIHECREFFSAYGIPSVFVSDNGRQFTSTEFARFMKMNGIVQKFSAPYHPATNGQAERFIQTMKTKLKAMQCDRSEVHSELCSILLSYRKMIHPATGRSPSMLVFGRQMRSRLDLMVPSNDSKGSEIEQKTRELNVGSRVAAREYVHENKWEFGTIKLRFGKLHYLISLDDGREWKRHIDQIRLVGTELRRSPRDDQISRGERHVFDENVADHEAEAAHTDRTVTPDSIKSSTTTLSFGLSTSETSSDAELPTPRKHTDSQQPSCPVEFELRRSNRTIKPPVKLNLLRSCESSLQQSATIRLDTIFARFGLPISITADNGPQFSSDEFKTFCETNNIKLIKTTPYWPQQNGEVERQNRSILKRLSISQACGTDWVSELNKYLLMYRSTPHSTTGRTPSEMLLGYNIRDRVPTIRQPKDVDEEMVDREKEMKEKGKLYADKRRNAKPNPIAEGDQVLLKK
ncbi:uncharacterized protein K02A2.6-like [Topomyia yanbarensis]|uniref:uncharacterized protein K02A2.6-like n=1 Tax=Topomyia yanbarensis TaxID=2498891 RepID=UPI00273B62B1|nr:uncharacterized protein K02A2.6-like [Topomyia yanbarensis]